MKVVKVSNRVIVIEVSKKLLMKKEMKRSKRDNNLFWIGSFVRIFEL